MIVVLPMRLSPDETFRAQLIDILVALTDVQAWGTIIKGNTGALNRVVRHGKAWEHVRGLWEDAFHLLFLAVRGCHLNGVYLVSHVPVLTAHLGLESSGGGELLPLYIGELHGLIIAMHRDNPGALGMLEDAEFDMYGDLLSKQAMLTPVYLRMLHVLSRVRGHGVVNNQKRLCNMVMDPECAWGCQTVMRGDSVLVCMPSTGGGDPQWVSVQELNQDPVASEYYTEYVHLLALITSGRSRTVVECTSRLAAEGFISYELCVICMCHTNLPLRVCAAYCALLQNGFVDSAPQEDRCKADHLQVWSELYNQIVKVNLPVPQEYGEFAQIKDFILKYIEENDVQGLDEAKDLMTLAVVRLTRTLVLFGFYNFPVAHVLNAKQYRKYPAYRQRFEDLRRYQDPLRHQETWAKDVLETRILLQPLMLLLDSSTDMMSDGSGRRVSSVVIETKKTLCECLSLMSDIRLKLRINRALQVYDHDLQNGLVFQVRVIIICNFLVIHLRG